MIIDTEGIYKQFIFRIIKKKHGISLDVKELDTIKYISPNLLRDVQYVEFLLINSDRIQVGWVEKQMSFLRKFNNTISIRK
jgi:hypothetical protein